jgi:Flp pilus assembly protein TadG
MCSRTREDRGAAAVELALLLPLLLVLIFGIIDFGRMLNAQISATEAAREAARSAALGEAGATALQDRVDLVFGDPGAASPSLDSACSTPPAAGEDAVVTVTYDFVFVTPVAALVGIDPITITGTGVMPCRA